MTKQEWLNAATEHAYLNEACLDMMLSYLNAVGLKDDSRMRDLMQRLEALGDAGWGARNIVRDCGVSERKMRLFAVACCRRIWHALLDERSRTAVEVAERYADGLATVNEMRQATLAAYSARGYNGADYDDWRSSFHGAEAVCEMLNEQVISITNVGIAADQATIALYYEHLRQRGVDIHRAVPDAEIDWAEEEAIRQVEEQAQRALLLDVFGNPFRPASIDERRVTSAVVGLARDIYDERAFNRLPLLADALVDAGCSDEQVLAHCRSGGPHVRGCWVLDLILGKS